MRRFIVLAVVAALAPESSLADRLKVSLSSGYNPTALKSEFNRGTALQFEFNDGRPLLAGSFDSRGLGSLGIGWIASSTDFDRDAQRYPMLMIFGSRDETPGLELKFHEEWFSPGQPIVRPSKLARTVFITEAGVVTQAGHGPKIRVTQGLVTAQRRHPSRSQGLEWIWEYTRDHRGESPRGAVAGSNLRSARPSTRKEQWFFVTRELGIGIVRLQIGATYKTVYRSNPGSRWRGLSLNSVSSTTQEPVLMGRVAYEIRRWN